jgi:hypothetical protein
MEFWVSIGSTYSYLTVMRIDAASRAAGVDRDVAALQRARHHGGAEQHPLSRQAGENRLHVARHGTPCSGTWSAHRGPGPLPAPATALRKPGGAPGLPRRLGCELHARDLPPLVRGRQAPGRGPEPVGQPRRRGGRPRRRHGPRPRARDRGGARPSDRAREIPRRLRLPQFRRGRRGLLGRRPARSRARLGHGTPAALPNRRAGPGQGSKTGGAGARHARP